MKNSLFWSFNLPLQVDPIHSDPEDENSPVTGSSIVIFMPRKSYCARCDLSECLGDQTREEFFESAAVHLENLARLMRLAGKNEKLMVYYSDEGMDKEPR